MKSNIMKSAYVAVLASVFVFAVAFFSMTTKTVQAEKPEIQDESDSQARKLEGTWRAQVTLRVCQTGDIIRTFPALITFNQGGTFTASAAGVSPARVSPDYGIWRHTGGHTYNAKSEAFLFNPTGDWIGTQHVTRIIEIGEDPNVLSANTSIEFLDTSENVIGTGCATAVAHRLE